MAIEWWVLPNGKSWPIPRPASGRQDEAYSPLSVTFVGPGHFKPEAAFADFMAEFADPHLIHFLKLGEPGIGYISVTEQQQLVPFAVQRIFWTYYTPESIVRGRHAHHRAEQVLVAAAGRITVTTELADGRIEIFRLEDPHVGLYVPPHAWHTMQYSHSAVQLVMASAPYQEADYIREYESFKRIWGPKA